MNSDKEFIKSYLDDLSSEELHIISYLINCMVTKKGLYKKWYEEKNKNDKAIEVLEKGITFCENDSQGIYDKCNIATNREKEVLDILNEVSE